MRSTNSIWKKFAVNQVFSEIRETTEEGLFDLLLNSDGSALVAVLEEHCVLVHRPFDFWAPEDIANHVVGLATRAEEAAMQAQKTSCQVKHFGAYECEETVMTHQLDVEDHRERSGQVRVTLGELDGDIDDFMSLLVEVGADPIKGIDQAPCVHLHRDDDELAISLFKMGSKIILRPETGLQVKAIGSGMYVIG